MKTIYRPFKLSTYEYYLNDDAVYLGYNSSRLFSSIVKLNQANSNKVLDELLSEMSGIFEENVMEIFD